MKNREYYKDKLYQIACAHDIFAVNEKTGEVTNCKKQNCCDCLFYHHYKFSTWDTCYKRAIEWLEQEHTEPILDDVEKRYLENFIRPFKNRVRSVTKRMYSDDFAYLQLHINSLYSNKQQGELINLPLFVWDKLYRNMTLRKKFTVKDLKLFEEEEE